MTPPQPFRGEGWVFREGGEPSIARPVLARPRAAGRLEYIQPEDFIFCPLEICWEFSSNAAPEAWDTSRPLTPLAVRQRLEYWSDLAGLQPQDVKWDLLRITALLLRVQAGTATRRSISALGFPRAAIPIPCCAIDSERRAGKVEKETQAPQDGEAKPPASGANAFYAQAIPVQDLARLESSTPTESRAR